MSSLEGVFGGRSLENDLGKEKAPVPDGFIIAFFQHCWSIVKREVGFIFEFHSKGVFEKSLNSTFICLMPKVAAADDINKFNGSGGERL